ncbi:ATP-binding protein [Streptomyces pacificus]|uniref:Uncharacterized protein n=1 Tax=Streptomyces pacificus TaxID=2705029 RepID=A0A6A0AU92_9ACTN|nr:ATP-binding protein [Streptomyces pacificus]GFH36025.1 hypothetical protein SCWH03_22470 [Streptomyces pacificus]
MPGPKTSIEVSGVRGHVTIGDNNVVVSAERSFVQIVQPGQRPAPVARQDMTLLPRRPQAAVGRERELAELRSGLDDHGAWQIHGPAGIGKSTLLRQAAHRLADERGGAVVFVDAAGREPGDVLQDVFEACYDAPGYRPAHTELRRLMADVTADIVLDDLEVEAEDLDTVLDALPSSALLYASGQRTLLGKGGTLALGGLGHKAAMTLLSQTLGRRLEAAEEPVAEELWRRTSGAPLPLLRAAAADRLVPAARLDGLLPELLAALTGVERDVAGILAVARDGGVSMRLLAFLLDGTTGLSAVCDRLEARGVVVATARGHRLAPEIGGVHLAGLRPGSAELAALARQLTHWVSMAGTEAAAVVEDTALLTAVIDAATEAGRSAEGARLARAASPVFACSLRTGAWGRVLERGIAAAESAGLRDILAYLMHEDGVRKLVSGKRLLAAAAFASAAAYWRELGSDGHASAADAAAQSCGGDPASGADPAAQPGIEGSGGSGSDIPDLGDHGSVGDINQEVGNQLVSSLPPADPGSVAMATKAGVATKAGMSVSAKAVIGGGLAASVTAGGVVLSQQADAESVPVKVTVATRVLEANMPGDPEGTCLVGEGATDCTKVVKSKKGEAGPVSVDPAQPLPAGVSLVYWGCDEGAQSDSCSVTSDKARHVCVTTTSFTDEAARRRCAELTGSPMPTAMFRPLAWTTKTEVKALLKPGGRPQVLATTGDAAAPGMVVWSEDAAKVAWLETGTGPLGPDGAGGDVIKLRDLKSGVEHSWPCFGCTIAFLDGELISGGGDIVRYPANGGEPVREDLDEIPNRLGHDGPPDTMLLNVWNGDRLQAYAVSRVGDLGQQSVLFRLESPTKARKIRDLPRFGYSGLVRTVSPDGARAVVEPPNGQPPYNSCGEGSYPAALLDLATGAQTRLDGPGVGYRVDDTWFDADGVAHVVYRAEKGVDATSCFADADRAAVHYTLASGAGSWERSGKAPGRLLAVADGRQITHVADGGALTLVIGEGAKKSVLDTDVQWTYPSAAHAGDGS